MFGGSIFSAMLLHVELLDGMLSILSYQKSLFGYILEGLQKENVCNFWNTLRPFDIFYGHMYSGIVVIRYIFPRFGTLLKTDRRIIKDSGVSFHPVHTSQAGYFVAVSRITISIFSFENFGMLKA
jgi:hypothetical protein